LFDALFHFREAYALFRDLNCHTMDMATLCIHTGTVLFNQGDFDGSLKSYHEALPIVARLEPESSSEAGLYKKIGAALYQQGDYEAALRNFRQAMAIYEKIEPPTSLQLEKLRFLINFLSADAFNSRKEEYRNANDLTAPAGR
jgi:tetratricopeptide (TPR) repeat protein